MINITFAFTGRLGNLLFQIAAIESYCRNKGFKPRYFHTDVTTKYSSTILSSVPWENKTTERFWDIKHPHFEYVPLPEVKANTRFHPPTYLQSEKYFSRDVAIGLFGIRETTKQKLLAWYPDLPERVAVHVRRGDYLKLPDHHPVCSVDYYLRGTQMFPGQKFAIFSDDIPWCKENLNISDAIFPLGNSDEEELYMMSLCESNIIANSSFSWWGAYLNENPNKRVIAPSKWFGPKLPLNTSDLIPQSWIKI